MIRLFAFFFITAACPWMTGTLLFAKKEDMAAKWPLCFRYLSGTVCMWAVYELLAVPAIMLQLPLHILTGVWGFFLLSALFLFVFCCRKADFRKYAFPVLTKRKSPENRGYKGRQAADRPDAFGKILICVLLLSSCFIIGRQCLQYFEKQHVDDDDARFIAIAVSAWEHDTMLLDNPATGDATPRPEGEVTKEVTSPWPVYLATLASLIRIHPTILAHTVLPVWLLLLRYIAVWTAGTLLFSRGEGGAERELEQQAWFLLFAAVGTQYFGGSIYSASAFTLSRIWQGKAVLAAFLLPWILLTTFGMEWRREAASPDLGLLMITAAASCLVSGMGIMTAGALIGTYALWHGGRRRDLVSALRIMACAWPCIACGLLYLHLR